MQGSVHTHTRDEFAFVMNSVHAFLQTNNSFVQFARNQISSWFGFWSKHSFIADAFFHALDWNSGTDFSPLSRNMSVSMKS